MNTQFAAGILHAGLSYTGAQRFLSSLEVPTPDYKTIKRREREIGTTIEEVGKESCEQSLSLENDLSENCEGQTKLVVSYDMGWQRRSSGCAYNSRSGHGVLIGDNNGKVLEYGSRISNCKV